MSTFTGVFPVYDIGFEIATSGRTETPVFSTIKDMENATISIETGVETWNSITEGGWQRAFATAKSYKISMNGKRSVGDAGNDYVANMAYSTGKACESTIRITFPNGDVLTGNVVVSVTEGGGGDATKVAPLAFDLISDGKPEYKPATAA